MSAVLPVAGHRVRCGGRLTASVPRRITDRTTRSLQSVRRYLDALALPEVVHLLLCDGPDGDAQSWQTLRYCNENVCRCRGLSWRVAARLGRRMHATDVSVERTIGTAANAVEYDTASALEFVNLAMEDSTVPFQSVHRRTQQETQYEELVGPECLGGTRTGRMGRDYVLLC